MGGGTGTTDEKSLGKKVLDSAKYVGKNFWKIVPPLNLIAHYNYVKKNYSDEDGNKKPFSSLDECMGFTIRTGGQIVYSVLGTLQEYAWISDFIKDKF